MTQSNKIDKMFEVVLKMMKNAYAPYSNYHVGACVEAEDGTLFGGCNVENSAFGSTICAERNAISFMIAAGKRNIKSIALAGSGDELCFPCGACRQYMSEFAAPNTPIYLFDKSQRYRKILTLGKLLPMPIGNFKLQLQRTSKGRMS